MESDSVYMYVFNSSYCSLYALELYVIDSLGLPAKYLISCFQYNLYKKKLAFYGYRFIIKPFISNPIRRVDLAFIAII